MLRSASADMVELEIEEVENAEPRLDKDALGEIKRGVSNAMEVTAKKLRRGRVRIRCVVRRARDCMYVGQEQEIGKGDSSCADGKFVLEIWLSPFLC